MNNFFDYNLDTQQYDGSVYEVHKTSEDLWQEWLEINKKIEKHITNYQGYLPFAILPVPLQFLTVIGILLCMPYISVFIKLGFTGEITLAQAYANAPQEIILGVCAISVTVPLVLFLIVMKILHNKKDYSGLIKEKKSIREKIYKEWNISTDLEFFTVDVLSVEYLKNSGEKTICKKYKHRYKVQEWNYFLQNDTLYFTDYRHLFAIEMAKIESMSPVANGEKIYMTDGTESSGKANITWFIPGYYKVKGYGIIQISDFNGQFEILVPAYAWDDWDNVNIKTVIEEYQKALKVCLEHQKEIVFYKVSNYFISEDIEWNEYCACCVELRPADLQEEEIEQVKSDFLSIISNTSAWDEKLMPLIEKETGKGKAAYDKEEFEFIGLQVKSKHEVSFWYDMDEDYIEIYGSIEDDMWTAKRRKNCSIWEM